MNAHDTTTRSARIEERAMRRFECNEHTPGPWTIEAIVRKGTHPSYRISTDYPRYPNTPSMVHARLYIGEVSGHRLGAADNVPGDAMNDLAGSGTEGCQQANAQLIAAAPDLLEACHVALHAFRQRPDREKTSWENEAWPKLQAAIAKTVAPAPVAQRHNQEKTMDNASASALADRIWELTDARKWIPSCQRDNAGGVTYSDVAAILRDFAEGSCKLTGDSQEVFDEIADPILDGDEFLVAEYLFDHWRRAPKEPLNK